MTIPGVYSQRNPAWASLILGYNPPDAVDGWGQHYTIGAYGCAITSIANMLWYMGNATGNPHMVNDLLKAYGGFEEGGGTLLWDAVPKVSDDIVSHGMTNLTGANLYVVDEGSFAILQVHKDGFPMHFVLLTRTGEIADPWDGQIKNLAASGYVVDGCHLYGDRTPNFTTVPQPTSAPVIVAPDEANNGELTMTPEVKAVLDDHKVHIIKLENQLTAQTALLEDMKKRLMKITGEAK